MALVNKPFKRLLVGAAFRLRSYGNICIKQTETEYKMVGQYSDGIFQIEPVAKVWVDSHQLKKWWQRWQDFMKADVTKTNIRIFKLMNDE